MSLREIAVLVSVNMTGPLSLVLKHFDDMGDVYDQ